MYQKTAEELLKFLSKSPTSFHAVFYNEGNALSGRIPRIKRDTKMGFEKRADAISSQEMNLP